MWVLFYVIIEMDVFNVDKINVQTWLSKLMQCAFKSSLTIVKC